MSHAETQLQKQRRVTLTAQEAADYVGVSPWLIYELVKRREIPCVKAGGKYLFRAETLIKWMEEKEAASITVDTGRKLKVVSGK